jgi:hypothetical protein
MRSERQRFEEARTIRPNDLKFVLNKDLTDGAPGLSLLVREGTLEVRRLCSRPNRLVRPAEATLPVLCLACMLA